MVQSEPMAARHQAAQPAAVAVLALLLYLPTLHAGLVWDDPLILHHPLYHPPVDWGAVLRSPLVLAPNYYRPLAVATLVALGDAAAAHHLLNLLLHTLNTGLVGLLALRLSGRAQPTGRTLVAPLVYAVHPALVEGVAFISSRFDLLATTFLLLALLADLALRSRRLGRSVAVGGCVLLAALCKEMAAGFLLVLPLWHLATEEGEREEGTPPKRPPSGPPARNGPVARVFRLLQRSWPVYAAVLGALLAYVALRVGALGYLYRAGTGQSVAVGQPLPHALLIARALAEYLLLALWPFTTLRPIHFSVLPLPLDAPATWLAPVAVLAAALGMALLWRRQRPSAALGVAGLLALAPVLQIVPLELGGGAFAAERFLLFPLTLAALAVGLLAAHARHWAWHWGSLLWALAAVATVQLTVPHWRSEEALWTWAMRRAPQSATPYTNLALVAINQGRPAEGMRLAQEALRRNPNDATAQDQLGLALFHLGRYQEAEAAFARAVELAPEDPLFRSNLAGALREQGRLAEAERLLVEEVLPRAPKLWVAHLNLGLVYLKADRPDLAGQALERALALAPRAEQPSIRAALEQLQDPRRWLRLSDLLLANGEAAQALEAVAQAEALGASATDVAVGRSAALVALGRGDEAEALLRVALTAAPQDARLHHNLGLAARRRGDERAARSSFQRAAELAPDWELPRRHLEERGQR